MLESDDTDNTTTPSDPVTAPGDAAPAPRKRAPRKSAAKAAPPAPEAGGGPDTDAPPAAPRKRAPRKAVRAAGAPAPDAATAQAEQPAATGDEAAEDAAPAKKAAPRKAAARKAPAKKAAKKAGADLLDALDEPAADDAVLPAGTDGADGAAAEAPAPVKAPRKRAAKKAAPAAEAPAPAESEAATAGPEMAAPGVLFMAPVEEPAPRRRRAAKKAVAPVVEAEPEISESETTGSEPVPADADLTEVEDAEDGTAEPEDVREVAAEQATGARRRRRRGRRGRGGANRGVEGGDEGDSEDGAESGEDTATTAAEEADEEPAEESAEGGEGGTRRRRRRRRSSGSGSGEDTGEDNPPNTVTHVREPKPADDGVKGVKGSTRLEAKRQRRRDGRETTRRRAPILTEAEFLARREAVDRVMAVRQSGDRTQIAVLEDDILVEHYVTRASATSYVGNVYLGRVQNVLPSMEAAFVDIGKGRNGVLYAGEVNWDAAGLEGKSRAIENALKSGDAVLVQVTKDPIGHKGARLTSQVSLPGRFLVYVPGGGMTGISRRLPDTERHRLKAILKKIVPEDAGVIVRTAAEGASEEDLTRDVERLKAQWEAIEAKAAQTKSAPTLVHGEPDLAIRVVRDVFNEDFKNLVVQGNEAWETISEYLGSVAPDLAQRAAKHTGTGDLFHDLRVDEQLMKALDRKVWLPSGGSLVIDRTEAMTVIDVNTGKFVGAGGNLEQTVTRNNLEAAEEIVRQLRLRDVGGIVVIDFIDMVLESNRELVLRRLTECLGRDRTKHQVAEVTSLGLVQMTRKRVGEGLLEAFSETCEHCHGRGVLVHGEPVDKQGGGSPAAEDEERGQGKGRRRRGGRNAAAAEPAAPVEPPASDEQRKAASAAIAAIHRAAHGEKEAGGEIALVDELASGLVAAVKKAEADLEAAGQAAVAAEQAAEAAEATPEATEATPEAAEPAPEVTEAAAATEAQPETTAEPAPAEPVPAATESLQQAVGSVTVTEAAPAPAPEPATDGAPAPRRRRRAASRPAGPPVPVSD